MKKQIVVLAVAYLFNLPSVFASIARVPCGNSSLSVQTLRMQDRWMLGLPEIQVRLLDFLSFYTKEISRDQWQDANTILQAYIDSFPVTRVYRAIAVDKRELLEITQNGFYSSAERSKNKPQKLSIAGSQVEFSDFIVDIENQIIGSQSDVISVSKIRNVAMEVVGAYGAKTKSPYLFSIDISDFYLVRFSHLANYIHPARNLLNLDELRLNNLLIRKEKIDEAELFIRRHIPAANISNVRKL